MSNLNENDIAKILKEPSVGDVKFTENGWKEYTEKNDWLPVPAVDVDMDSLLLTYEDLIMELSDKEIRLINLKETYVQLEQDIIDHTDFKVLYGKNNDTVRKNHVRNELKDMVDERNTLELSVNWLKRYISFLKELIRTKRTIMEIKK